MQPSRNDLRQCKSHGVRSSNDADREERIQHQHREREGEKEGCMEVMRADIFSRTSRGGRIKAEQSGLSLHDWWVLSSMHVPLIPQQLNSSWKHTTQSKAFRPPRVKIIETVIVQTWYVPYTLYWNGAFYVARIINKTLWAKSSYFQLRRKPQIYFNIINTQNAERTLCTSKILLYWTYWFLNELILTFISAVHITIRYQLKLKRN